MRFYEILDAENRRAYRANLADAHKLAKLRRPYNMVRIEVVEFGTDKATMQAILMHCYEDGDRPAPARRTGIGYLLSERGALRPVDPLPEE